jgi:heme oxygenase
VTSALHQQLRERTRDDHQAVEGLLRLGDRDGLAWSLSALLGFFAPVEERLVEVLQGEVPELAARARAPRMRADLLALGCEVRPRRAAPSQLPARRRPGEGAGGLYVLEGSLLGAPHVAKMLAERGLYASTFEVPAPELGRRWRETLLLLERSCPREALAGACDTFRALRRWLEGDPRCTTASTPTRG